MWNCPAKILGTRVLLKVAVLSQSVKVVKMMNDWKLIFHFGSPDLLGFFTDMFTRYGNSSTDLTPEI